jgi:hypothetical protein
MSTPMRSMEDGGSHHGLRGHRRGRAWAGNEDADTRKDSEDGGRGLVVLLQLRFLSRRWRWWLLFLSDQVGKTEAQRDSAAVRPGNRCKISSWGKGVGWPVRSII